MNPLLQLAEHGQSVWLDYIRRGMTRSGELARLIELDGLRGMTSNPAIFLKAITGSDDYDDVLGELVGSPDLDARQIFERLAVVDVREAADALRPVYDRTEKLDGYVSLEVSPSLAFDAEGTVEEARRLWQAVDRPNLMIKVPGTEPGLTAIEQLTGEGINVNVTLIFARQAYRRIALAYQAGLERWVSTGGNPAHVASVASFFVSRIDTEVDTRLAARLKATSDPKLQQRLRALPGKAAVANAKLAYQIYQELVASERWQALAAKGARPQRLLWASTGTKNAAYSDVKYVDELCGPDTVNTVPPQTFDAFRDHGTPGAALTEGTAEAQRVIDELDAVGVPLHEVTTLLLERGVTLFEDAIDALLSHHRPTCSASKRGPRLDRMDPVAAPRARAGGDGERHPRLGRGAEHHPPVGQGRDAVDRLGGGALAGLARRGRRSSARARPRCSELAALVEGARVHPRAAAGHGRLQPRARRADPYLRIPRDQGRTQGRGQAADRRFHRSGPGPSPRVLGPAGHHAGDRVEQVG